VTGLTGDRRREAGHAPDRRGLEVAAAPNLDAVARARASRPRVWIGLAAAALLALSVPVSVGQVAAPELAAPADPLIAGFASSTVASVSDAVDQIVGRRGYLSHDVRPYVAGTFVGRAATALVKPATPEQATPALAVKHSVEMIDAANAGDVGVIVMEGSLDVAAIGGLMGTAAKARGMAGMVLDGAGRAVVYLPPGQSFKFRLEAAAKPLRDRSRRSSRRSGGSRSSSTTAAGPAAR